MSTGRALAEALDRVAPDLPGGLVPERAAIAARRRLGRLPDAFSAGFFETRLREGEGKVDFGACIPGPVRGAGWRSAASGRGPAWWLPIRGLVRNWSRRGGVFARIPFLWIEFDAVSAERGAVPGVYPCMDPHFGAPGPESDPVRCLSAAREFISLARRCLPGLPDLDPAMERLDACFAALPPRSRFLHLALMPSRRPAEIKLNMAMPRPRFLRYLGDIGHPCRGGALEFALARILPPRRPVHFDLALGAGVSPRIGLEAFPGNLGREGCLSVLGAMARHRLCTGEKAAALRAWTGVTQAPVGRRGTSFPVRRWFGLKLVSHVGDRIETKGYLGFMPTPSFTG